MSTPHQIATVGRRLMLVLIVLVAAGCGLLGPTPLPVETYTLGPGGVITAQPGDVGGLVYTVEGRDSDMHVSGFVGGGLPDVGDVLISVEGHPDLGMTAREQGPGCWIILGDAHVDGNFIEVDVGPPTTRLEVDYHVRVRKSPAFDAPVNSNGELLDRVVCVDSDGIAVGGQ